MSYELLQQYVNESSSIVFFGGAGVSTESGIPDFRSVDGLYNQKYDYPPETILSHTFFMKKPEEFFRFYRDKMLPLEAKPNKAHLKLAQWEKEGKLLAVVTQNIDGLHQAAGSKRFMSFTAVFTGTTAQSAANSSRRNISGTAGTRFLSAPAAAGSNRMWFFMRKVWITTWSPARCMPSLRRIC